MNLLFFELIFLIISINACSQFQCTIHPDPLDNNICAIFDSDHSLVKVGECPSGTTCELSKVKENKIRCSPIPQRIKYPGDRSNDPKECKGTIMNGFCRGKYLGEACSSTIECDIDLRCGAKNTCERAGKKGDYCDKVKVCRSYLYCDEGVCSNYGNVPNGFKPTDSDIYQCKSHYIKEILCAEVPKLKGQIFVDQSDKCTYTNGDELKPKCKYHKDGKAICTPEIGGSTKDWENLLKYLNFQPRCNPETKMSQCDFGEYIGERRYLEGRISYYQLNYFEDLQENLPCVQKYNFPEYFEFLKRYNKTYLQISEE